MGLRGWKSRCANICDIINEMKRSEKVMRKSERNRNLIRNRDIKTARIILACPFGKCTFRISPLCLHSGNSPSISQELGFSASKQVGMPLTYIQASKRHDCPDPQVSKHAAQFGPTHFRPADEYEISPCPRPTPFACPCFIQYGPQVFRESVQHQPISSLSTNRQ